MSDFEIICKISDEAVPGGLKVDAVPKSYNKYKDLFDAAREVRKIDDFRELRIPYYPDFSPFEYQREAVLMMLGRFRGKGIFGDQVGLGKTVEVGMTVSEYAERGAVKNVLLLCPKKLDFQWAQEIKDKFSTHFEGCIVHSFSDMHAHEKIKRGGVTMYIMTFDSVLSEVKALKKALEKDISQADEWLGKEKYRVKRADNYDDMIEATRRNKELYSSLGEDIDEGYMTLLDVYGRKLPDINMIVVDEADALLSTDPGKTLQIYKVVEHLAGNPTVVYKILMSATPIRRQLGDIYRLMKIVRPEQFHDMHDFIVNYCFGKPRLNDFKGDELKQLKGLIDQLFTRNRLTSKTVQQSLKPLTIKEVTYLNFNNFASPDFEREVREAVMDGLSYGESESEAANLKKIFDEYDGAEFGSENHWAWYVRNLFFESDDPPIDVTEEKNEAFARSLLSRVKKFNGAEADAVKFACENYVIPSKRGHHIRYDARSSGALDEEKAYDDALFSRRMRRARIENNLAEANAEDLEYYDAADINAESKYAEFDRLVNEFLPDRKVLVFSDSGMERNTFVKLVESVSKGRVLSGEGDTENRNYLKFASGDPKYSNAVYFAVNGEEKGFNMQFCSDLIITNLPHDPNLVEQIVGRVSRIGQRKDMHVYVFTAKDSLEYHLYKFYNDDLHLFSDWDGDNTFIIGGAVAAFLEENSGIKRELLSRIEKGHTADGEKMEIGFPQIAEYLWEKCMENPFMTFDGYAPWLDFKKSVRKSIESFYLLVREFGEQEIFGDEDLN